MAETRPSVATAAGPVPATPTFGVDPTTGAAVTATIADVAAALSLLNTKTDGIAADLALVKTATQGTATDIHTIAIDTADVIVTPTAAQDPIFDHANSTKTSITTSAGIITPPAGCRFVRISTDIDIVINTGTGSPVAAAAATDGATAGGVRIVANIPEIVPCTAGVEIRALSLGASATVRATPMRVRP